MSVIAFLVVGLIAGLLARALMPGEQSMGLIATTLLGMAGSLLGSLVGSLFSPAGQAFSLRSSGLVMSVIGAFVVLGLVIFVQRRRIAHH